MVVGLYLSALQPVQTTAERCGFSPLNRVNRSRPALSRRHPPPPGLSPVRFRIAQSNPRPHIRCAPPSPPPHNLTPISFLFAQATPRPHTRGAAPPRPADNVTRISFLEVGRSACHPLFPASRTAAWARQTRPRRRSGQIWPVALR